MAIDNAYIDKYMNLLNVIAKFNRFVDLYTYGKYMRQRYGRQAFDRFMTILYLNALSVVVVKEF